MIDYRLQILLQLAKAKVRGSDGSIFLCCVALRAREEHVFFGVARAK